MRFLFFSILHLASIIAVFAPVVFFALPGSVEVLPLASTGLFLGLSIYWFFAPCAIAVLSGMIIDWLSRCISGENYYTQIKWSKTRKRVAFMTLLGLGILYLHFWLT